MPYQQQIVASEPAALLNVGVLPLPAAAVCSSRRPGLPMHIERLQELAQCHSLRISALGLRRPVISRALLYTSSERCLGYGHGPDKGRYVTDVFTRILSLISEDC